nr:hypothetical protein [Moraxella sp.]
MIAFSQFFENEYGESLDEQSLNPTQLLGNMNLMLLLTPLLSVNSIMQEFYCLLKDPK